MPKRNQGARTLVSVYFPTATGRARARKVKRWADVMATCPGRKLTRPTTRFERVCLRLNAGDPNNPNSTYYLWEPTR